MERGGRNTSGGYRAGSKRPRDEDDHPQRPGTQNRNAERKTDAAPNGDRRGPYRDHVSDRRDDRPTRYDSRPYQASRGGAPPHRPNGDPRQPPTDPRRGSVSPSSDMRSRQDKPGQPKSALPQADREEISAAMRQPDWELNDDLVKKVMGFSAFNTTHNKKVPGNAVNYGVHRTKKSEYRQYMNREGGFNRPLSPSRGKVYAKPADLSNIDT